MINEREIKKIVSDLKKKQVEIYDYFRKDLIDILRGKTAYNQIRLTTYPAIGGRYGEITRGSYGNWIIVLCPEDGKLYVGEIFKEEDFVLLTKEKLKEIFDEAVDRFEYSVY